MHWSVDPARMVDPQSPALFAYERKPYGNPKLLYTELVEERKRYVLKNPNARHASWRKWY